MKFFLLSMTLAFQQHILTGQVWARGSKKIKIKVETETGEVDQLSDNSDYDATPVTP